MRRSAALTAGAMWAAVLVAGCGSSGKVTEVADGGGSSTSSTPAATVASTAPAGSKAALCAVVEEREAAFNASGVYFDKFTPFFSALKEMERAAPDEIRGDLSGLVEDLAPLEDLDPDERVRASRPIRERERFVDRMARLVEYLEDECGLDLGGTTTTRSTPRRSTTTTEKESTDTTVSRLAQLRESITTNYPGATWIPKIESHSVATIGNDTTVTLSTADGPAFTPAEALEACEAASRWLYSDPSRSLGTVKITEGTPPNVKTVVSRVGEVGLCKPA